MLDALFKRKASPKDAIHGNQAVRPGGLFGLAGRNVLLTGGGQGLGKSNALALAACGANVGIIDLNPASAQATAAEIEQLGVKSMAIHGDVTSEANVSQAIDSIVSQWGRLDVLVNNAACAFIKPAEETTLEEFRWLFEVCVVGLFNCSRLAFGPMSRAGGGSIINMVSIAAMTVLAPLEHACYNSAKAAVIQLTKSLAVEWAPHNIRVNAIAPGFMATPPMLAMRDSQSDLYRQLIGRVPMGRPGEPGELHGAVVFLASQASSYMTGQVLTLDGGRMC